MRRLFLIRHAPAEPFEPGGGCYVGWSDPALGERGLSEARLVGKRFSGEESIKAVYSSDLSRARETASEVARALGLRVRGRARFRELNFGEWEGESHANLEVRDAERYAEWLADPEVVRPPGGETLAELRRRVNRGFDAAMSEAEREFGFGAGIAIVAHGGPLRLITARLLGMPPENHWRLGLAHSSVTTFDWAGEEAWDAPGSLPVLRAFNDLSHLKAGSP